MITLVSVALAASPLPGEATTDPSGVRVVLRGLVEQWDDPAIGSVYKSGTWLGGVGIVVPIYGPVLFDAEASFKRLTGAASTFEIAPLSALIEIGPRYGMIEPYFGAGPTWTVFSESGAPVNVQGAKIAAEARAGLRIDTGLVRPPMPPASDGPVRAVEVELYFGRRFTLPGGTGLSLEAWRGGLGFGVSF